MDVSIVNGAYFQNSKKKEILAMCRIVCIDYDHIP
jgi:hypothetical protein